MKRGWWVAAMVSRSLFGVEPFYSVPPFDFTRLSQLPWFVVLGVLCGVMAALFMKGLRWSDSFCSRLTIPLYARLGVAGLAVGCLAVLFPEVLGNGYDGTNEILHNPLPLWRNEAGIKAPGLEQGWAAPPSHEYQSCLGRSSQQAA